MVVLERVGVEQNELWMRTVGVYCILTHFAKQLAEYEERLLQKSKSKSSHTRIPPHPELSDVKEFH